MHARIHPDWWDLQIKCICNLDKLHSYNFEIFVVYFQFILNSFYLLILIDFVNMCINCVTVGFISYIDIFWLIDCNIIYNWDRKDPWTDFYLIQIISFAYQLLFVVLGVL